MSSVPPNTTSGGRHAALRSAHAMADISRTAAGRVARAAGCMARAAACMEGRRGRHYVPRVPSIVGPVILIGVGMIALLIYRARSRQRASGTGTAGGGRCC